MRYPKLTRYKIDSMIDENKSVKWNKEEVEKRPQRCIRYSKLTCRTYRWNNKYVDLLTYCKGGMKKFIYAIPTTFLKRKTAYQVIC